jgi:hypothetical protein
MCDVTPDLPKPDLTCFEQLERSEPRLRVQWRKPQKTKKRKSGYESKIDDMNEIKRKKICRNLLPEFEASICLDSL